MNEYDIMKVFLWVLFLNACNLCFLFDIVF